ncbi:MAG TPA: ribosomal protein S18-alanine N-acetyltransferase [Candidatus Acidoferrales bacterium]|nr:ribosomal protein S18-alanine N-acetyltransferase [Candidatus Acidoferrales bacterium]
MPAKQVEIRTATPADLPAVAAIQDASPEAAHWPVSDYLSHQFLVATVGDSVAGFLVSRTVGPGEQEILNLAVSPDFRGKGIGRTLFQAAIREFQGLIFLEVRESNSTARSFYKSLKFQEVALRQNYYREPPEAAIVMKFHSC